MSTEDEQQSRQTRDQFEEWGGPSGDQKITWFVEVCFVAIAALPYFALNAIEATGVLGAIVDIAATFFAVIAVVLAVYFLAAEIYCEFKA